jgi:hypothetical protein
VIEIMPIALAGWVLMLAHAVKNPAFESNERLIWVLVCVLGGPLGALVYFWMHYRDSGSERVAREQEASF